MKKIPPPESQIQEILFELINRLFVDRKTMMLSSGVLNLTAQISNIRNKGINIASNEVTTTNKFNREVKFVRYSLKDKKEAVKVYLNMKKNQTL